jgi:beta-N-acetylhexosaminidase
VAAPLARLVPGTTTARVADGNGALPAALADAGDRPLVLVVRDAHRYPWVADALGRVLAARPDAIVVEMGIPVTVAGAVHVATHGATSAAGQAAAELLTGLSVSAQAGVCGGV